MNQNFEKILNEHGPSVYRLALSRLKNPDKATDIYQETFLLLLEKKPNFKHKNQLRVWLIRTTQNLILREWRLCENTRTSPLDDITISTTDSSTAELYNLMEQLTEKLKVPALLYYIEDMSVNDISKSLGISISAVKTRLARARKALKDILEEEI